MVLELTKARACQSATCRQSSTWTGTGGESWTASWPKFPFAGSPQFQRARLSGEIGDELEKIDRDETEPMSPDDVLRTKRQQA